MAKRRSHLLTLATRVFIFAAICLPFSPLAAKKITLASSLLLALLLHPPLFSSHYLRCLRRQGILITFKGIAADTVELHLKKNSLGSITYRFRARLIS